MTEQANASPTKKFFIEMLTRDIDLEDAIQDMVDNSIDALMETYGINISSSLLNNPPPMDAKVRRIDISFSERGFKIKDNCGGIPFAKAKDEVFRFGHIAHDDQATLGVYGIGLKRAIFKIGKNISIQSKAADDGFSLDIDVDEWVKDDEKKRPNWAFDIERTSGARSKLMQGTTIEIRSLLPQIMTRIKSGTLDGRIRKALALTYSLFLDQYVSIYVNNTKIEPERFELSRSDDVEVSYQSEELGDVNMQIVAGLASKPWASEKAGWYVICNGRVVVAADKSDLTGWGSLFASYQPKYRGFMGIIFFFSTHPDQLPWTTTKRGIMIFPHNFGHEVKLLAQTTSVSDVR